MAKTVRKLKMTTRAVSFQASTGPTLTKRAHFANKTRDRKAGKMIWIIKTTKEVEKASVPQAQTAAVRSPSTFKIDAHTAKWLNYKIDKPAGKTNKNHQKIDQN